MKLSGSSNSGFDHFYRRYPKTEEDIEGLTWEQVTERQRNFSMEVEAIQLYRPIFSEMLLQITQPSSS